MKMPFTLPSVSSIQLPRWPLWPLTRQVERPVVTAHAQCTNGGGHSTHHHQSNTLDLHTPHTDTARWWESTPGISQRQGFLKRELKAPVEQDVDIFHEVLHIGQQRSGEPRTRIVFIMGYAATAVAWYPVLAQLQKQAEAYGESYAVLLVDNRGVGRSSSPYIMPGSYSTNAMADDVLAVMASVGWDGPAHMVGFSMGAMIALKLGAAHPDRVLSLCCIGVTGGGLEVFPRNWHGMKLSLVAAGSRSIEQRLASFLQLHFCQDTLGSLVPHTGQEYREMLLEEYIALATVEVQPFNGWAGQFFACLGHRMTDADVQTIQQAGVNVCFVHGRHDIMAEPSFGEREAQRLGAPFLYVDGGHFVPRERAPEVCSIIVANMKRRPVPVPVSSPEAATVSGRALARQMQAAAAGAGSVPQPAVAIVLSGTVLKAGSEGGNVVGEDDGDDADGGPYVGGPGHRQQQSQQKQKSQLQLQVQQQLAGSVPLVSAVTALPCLVRATTDVMMSAS